MPNLFKYARHFVLWAGAMAILFVLVWGILTFSSAYPAAAKGFSLVLSVFLMIGIAAYLTSAD